MNISKMSNRVELQARTISTNAVNEQIETWATVQKIWAELNWVGARERLASEREISIKALRALVRYRAGLDSYTNRLLVAGEIYNITGIREIGRREGLELTCERAA
jgi:SPP1 family predicted phage head-tail adaptor